MITPQKLLLCLLLVAGCATELLPPSNSNAQPIANAGEDRAAQVGDVIELDASGSEDPDGDALSYSWSLLAPGSSTTTLTNTNYVTTNIEPDVPGEYRVTLIVTDGMIDSEPDTVVIVVGGAPNVTNNAPIAVVSGPATVEVGTVVTLDGTQSSDPDGDGIFFDWVLEGGPDGTATRLDDPLSPTPTFTPDVAGDYELSLVVTDGFADSAPAPIIVTATAVANLPPVADAGRNESVATGDTVTLDGTGSSDPEGAQLRYAWTLTPPAGSSATLTGADTATPSLQTDIDGSYLVELIVNDGELDSAPDAATINAVTGNVPPNANAGPAQSVNIGTLVQLDGSGSSDNEGASLSYQWTILSRPANSNVQLANPATATPSFTPSAVGVFEIQLIVNDGSLDSAPDTVLITTTSPNGAPTADAGSDQQARVLDTVTLSGSGSSDPDGDSLSHSWAFAFRPTMSTAVLTGANSAFASFEPDVSGTYTITLTVDDGRDDATDSVTVTVSEPWPQIEGDVVITEVMADPASLSDSAGEWFELYNPTSTAWDLRGCELSDFDFDSTVINSSLVIAPMSYITLARSASPGFGPDYVWSGYSLGNDGDEIILTCGADEIAQVALLTAFGFSANAPSGASLALLRDHLNETGNDDGANWCRSTTDYNGDSGTPGAPNQFQSACP